MMYSTHSYVQVAAGACIVIHMHINMHTETHLHVHVHTQISYTSAMQGILWGEPDQNKIQSVVAAVWQACAEA